MPFINVKMVEGRTSEQKKQLVAAITQSMVDICNATPESTMVVIEDIAKDHWAKGGMMLADRLAPKVLDKPPPS